MSLFDLFEDLLEDMVGVIDPELAEVYDTIEDTLEIINE